MIHIHELIAQCGNKQLQDTLCAAVKFDIGEYSELNQLSDLSSLTFFELPYELCAFQIKLNDLNAHAIILANDHNDGQITFCLYLGIKKSWISFPIWLVVDKPSKENNMQYCFSFGEMETGKQLFINKYGQNDLNLIPTDIRPFIFILTEMAAAIEVFSCSNIETIEHKPSEALNKSRIKKKKIPFFSYHTLHIKNTVSKTDKTSSTTTHASPRLHLRRGHIRRLTNGSRIWVTQCLVGDKSKGFVGKDYRISA